MKKTILALVALSVAVLACGFATPAPTMDIHAVETIAAQTMTALAPTQSPPTLIPIPSASAVPTQTPPSPPPPSSGTTRVQFAPGAVSSTVSGIVTFPDRPQYILFAFKNQQMTVQITSADNSANFAILGVGDGQPLKRFENEDRVWVGTLPSTQDYIIQVAVPGGSVSYSLTITIVGP